MDSHCAENRNESFSILMAGFSELLRNAYKQGFEDGREFERRITGEEFRNPRNDIELDFITRLSQDKSRVLSEAEQILNDFETP